MDVVLFVLFFMVALVFLLLSVEFTSSSDPKTNFIAVWGVFFLFASTILWFVLGAAVMEIEYPWEAYNASSGNVETGVHVFRSDISPYISYFFNGIGSIMIVIIVGFGGSIIHDKVKEFLRRR